MTIATRPSPAAELKRLESEWVDAGADAKGLGRELMAKRERHQELTDERVRVTRRDPALIDHNRAPVASIKDNPVRKIDEAVAELGDLDDLAGKVHQARELERVARERFEAHVREHYTAIAESRRPEGEALLVAYREAAAALADVADQLVGYGQRTMELGHICRLNTRRVPLDGVANAARTARAIADSPPALPVIPDD